MRLNAQPFTRELVLPGGENARLIELCGPLDEHLRLIESRLGVDIRRRGNRFQLVGAEDAVERTAGVLSGLDYMAPFVLALVTMFASAGLATMRPVQSVAQLKGE